MTFKSDTLTPFLWREDGAHNKTKWPQGNAFHLIYTDFLEWKSQRPFYTISNILLFTCPI